MYIYHNNTIKEEDIVKDHELVALGHHLQKFINFYKKNIRVTDEQTEMVLEDIKDISNRLCNREYDQLFDDPRVVDYTPLENSEYIDYDPSDDILGW